MYKNKFLLLSLWGVICAPALAQQALPENRPFSPDEQVQGRETLVNFKPNFHRTSPTENQPTTVVAAHDLLTQPELLTRLLISSLYKNDAKGVSLLLPLYQQLPTQDPVLLRWAQAMEARRTGNLPQSVALYRQVIAQRSDLTMARLQLAVALRDNQENEAAKDQFERVDTEVRAPELKAIIQQYREDLAQRDDWRFDGYVTYLKEDNVNNAPKSHVNADGWKPSSRAEKAQGVGYGVSTAKKWSLAEGYFISFESNASGKYYWDNRKYNEFSLRGDLGVGHRNAKHEIQFAPFAEQYWYANGEQGSEKGTLHRYSFATGLNLQWDYWLSSQWRYMAQGEYAKQNYTKRKDLTGNYVLLSNSLFYFASSQQYFGLGVDYYAKNAQREANSFQRYSARFVWGQEWWKGISSRLQLSYAKRYYEKALWNQDYGLIKAPAFYLTPQKNTEYGVSLTLWHRSFHFYGITPKITWSYDNVKSNNPLVEYDKHRVYLNFSKTF